MERQELVNLIIEKAVSYVAMGLPWLEAAKIATRDQTLYRDEVLHIGSYMKHYHGESA